MPPRAEEQSTRKPHRSTAAILSQCFASPHVPEDVAAGRGVVGVRAPGTRPGRALLHLQKREQNRNSAEQADRHSATLAALHMQQDRRLLLPWISMQRQDAHLDAPAGLQAHAGALHHSMQARHQLLLHVRHLQRRTNLCVLW